jgi:hypothetical protein
MVSVHGDQDSTADALPATSREEPTEDRLMLAASATASSDVLRRLATDKSPAVRSSVAGNLSTPRFVLRALATSRLVRTRSAVAGNPSTEVGVLDALARDESAKVRGRVAGNPAAAVETLTTLAADAELEVRTAVHRNPSASYEIRELAASAGVRQGGKVVSREVLSIWEECWAPTYPLTTELRVQFLQAKELVQICEYPASQVRRCTLVSRRLTDILSGLQSGRGKDPIVGGQPSTGSPYAASRLNDVGDWWRESP